MSARCKVNPETYDVEDAENLILVRRLHLMPKIWHCLKLQSSFHIWYVEYGYRGTHTPFTLLRQNAAWQAAGHQFKEKCHCEDSRVERDDVAVSQ